MKSNLKRKLITAAIACVLSTAAHAGHGHSRASARHGYRAPVHAYAGAHHDAYRRHDYGHRYHYSRPRTYFTTIVPSPTFYYSYYQPYGYAPPTYYSPRPYRGYAPYYYRGRTVYPGGLYFSFGFTD